MQDTMAKDIIEQYIEAFRSQDLQRCVDLFGSDAARKEPRQKRGEFRREAASLTVNERRNPAGCQHRLTIDQHYVTADP